VKGEVSRNSTKIRLKKTRTGRSLALARVNRLHSKKEGKNHFGRIGKRGARFTTPRIRIDEEKEPFKGRKGGSYYRVKEKEGRGAGN